MRTAEVPRIQEVADRPGRHAPRRKRPRWAVALVCVGTCLAVLSAGTLVAIEVLLKRYTGAVDQQPMLGAAGVGAPAKGQSALAGPLNLLLVGVDERTVEDDPLGTRADSIIVLHVNAAHDAAYMLSVPRDTLVDIPAFAKTRFTGTRSKINAAFQFGSDNGGGRAGGFELLATTVHNVTGMTFNAGAIVNFAGFESVVQTLGGVDLCIDQKVTSIHLNTHGQDLKKDGGAPAVYLPGCRHLEPWQALDYVRQRHLKNGDYDRQRHQQQFLKALARKAMGSGLSNPVGLDKVLVAAGHTLTVDRGAASLTDWLFLLKGLGTDRITMVRTNGGTYDSTKCPDGSSCEQLTPDSLAMFAAAKADSLPQFLAAHQNWIAADK
jgi:LCP family protein required for cell wall assembly